MTRMKTFISYATLGQPDSALAAALQSLIDSIRQWASNESVRIEQIDVAANPESQSGYVMVSCAVWFSQLLSPLTEAERQLVILHSFHPVRENEDRDCEKGINVVLAEHPSHAVTSTALCQAGERVVLAAVLTP
ncbi:MAG: hypothetical protein PHT12_03780 [Patescibacteria group bacterium]|nr:hypothetical protein [Patescibacteria group bacterium]